MTLLIVDKMHEHYPQLTQDQYWRDLIPQQLPFTVASKKYVDDYPQASTAKINLTATDSTIVAPVLRKVIQ